MTGIPGQRPGWHSWGPWHLDARTVVLWTDAGGYRYEVDLESCTTSAEVLDRICQIADKEWAATETGRALIISGLVTALADVLSPQAHLCSSGRGKRLTRAAIRNLVTKYGRRPAG